MSAGEKERGDYFEATRRVSTQQSRWVQETLMRGLKKAGDTQHTSSYFLLHIDSTVE